MNTTRKLTRTPKPRIALSDTDLERLFAVNATRSVAVLSKRTGLPYMLVYNVVHRRVHSVSFRHYTMLFGGPPPAQAPLKVEGSLFRAMVDLWRYLINGISLAGLYRELYGGNAPGRVDHRIFSGKIRLVDGRLEHAMREKFLAAGVDGPLLEQWLAEFAELPYAERTPYRRIRPALDFLEEKLNLHPTAVLHQSVTRYESGLLKSVSRPVVQRVEALKQAVENALRDRAGADSGKLREAILGGKAGYTLYSDIQDELAFVLNTGGRGAKYFLGRSRWTYAQGKARHIADWRARRILQACDRIIRQRPDLALSALPPSRRRMQIQPLIDVLMARTSQLLTQKSGIDLEKRILSPSRRRDEYSNPYHGFTPFEMAPRVLGMRRRAFDLMVTENCEIFRSVGRYAQRWYLSDLYLKELAGRKHFRLILDKYERMAKHPRRPHSDACLN